MVAGNFFQQRFFTKVQKYFEEATKVKKTLGQTHEISYFGSVFSQIHPKLMQKKKLVHDKKQMTKNFDLLEKYLVFSRLDKVSALTSKHMNPICTLYVI